MRELCYSVNHYRGRIKALKYYNRKDLKLNLASGQTKKEGFLNIDLESKSADVNLDLRKKLPFKNGSCAEVYSEHFLEHLEYPDEANLFLSEIYRVLKPKGLVTIGVPDTEWPMRSYFEGKKSKYFSIAKRKKWHPGWYRTRIEHINFHFRQGNEHKYAYDLELLTLLLKKHKFADIRRRNFNPIKDYKFHDPGTLYVEANKK